MKKRFWETINRFAEWLEDIGPPWDAAVIWSIVLTILIGGMWLMVWIMWIIAIQTGTGQ